MQGKHLSHPTSRGSGIKKLETPCKTVAQQCVQGQARFQSKKDEKKTYKFRIQGILLIMCYKRAFWKSLGRYAEGGGQIGI